MQKGSTFCQRWITVDTLGKIDPEKYWHILAKNLCLVVFGIWTSLGLSRIFIPEQIHIQKVELFIIVDVFFRNETRPADLW